MQRFLVLASVCVAAAVGFQVTACSTSTPASPGDDGGGSGSGSGSGSGGTDSGSGSGSGGTDSGSSSGTDSGSGSGTDSGSSGGTDSGSGDDAGVDAADAGFCDPDAGSPIAAKFDFAATAPTLNGGKGQVISAHVCDTVTWTNDDNATEHGIVSTTPPGVINLAAVTGSTAGVVIGSVQFTSAGTFKYQCAVHGSGMIGEVDVQ